MPKKQTVFSKNILRWFSANARDLPWRRTKDPYKIWVSEIMLQQTTVNAVIDRYKKWIKTFPDMKSIARAPRQKILKEWQGLGYYQRARNLHDSAKIIQKEFNGTIPVEADILRTLPGFGPYTVGAVLSIAFGIRSPIIDANVRRVVLRQLGVQGEKESTQRKMIYQFLEKNLPDQNPGDFNQALMEVGALICRHKEPICNLCPIKSSCKAYEKNLQEIIPMPRAKAIKKINAVVGIIEDKGRIFIQKRPPHGLLADMWEFPGGKVEKKETTRQALRREIREELNASVKSMEHFMNVRHYYTQFAVSLDVWKCRLSSLPRGDRMHRWVKRNQLRDFPMPSGSAKIVDKLVP